MNKEVEVLNLLASKGLTLGSVESVTGGLFGATICNVAGASAVYKGGLITYTAEVKEKVLGISKEAIDKYGVVSNEIAYLMALKGSEVLGSDITVAVTGNAGPTKEEGEAPVGQAWMAVCYCGKVWTAPVRFSLERNEFRKAMVNSMLLLIRSLFPEEKR